MKKLIVFGNVRFAAVRQFITNDRRVTFVSAFLAHSRRARLKVSLILFVFIGDALFLPTLPEGNKAKANMVVLLYLS